MGHPLLGLGKTRRIRKVATHPMNTLPKLHDATLETLTFHWEEGVVRIKLNIGINGTGAVMLEAVGVVRAACPRAFPWGPSDSLTK
jgi:hypothetical protein